MYLDRTPQVLSWTYEPKSIKYFDKTTQKVRRYFIDFVAVVKVGMFQKTIWIEVKPESETHPPKNKNNINAYKTWLTNESKWNAAKALAKSQGFEFHVLTENQLN